VESPADDPQVARVLVHRVRLERTRQFGACYLGLELALQKMKDAIAKGDVSVIGDIPLALFCWRAFTVGFAQAGIAKGQPALPDYEITSATP
jgi:hypothetical protein